MPFGELWRTQENNVEFRGELWRRMSEWLAGCLLLAVTLPMLMTHDFSGLLRGLIGCVCWAVFYVTAILIAAELGRQEILPTAVVFAPHVLMAIAAVIQQYVRLET
jgi:lipopolysaccharide export LptBFGC system permease protein LptF